MLGVQYSFTTAAGVAGVVCIQTESTVHDILQLYYGARCIFSHGLPSQTLSEGWAASNFPSEHDLAIGMGFAPAAADLVKFFQRLKEEGSTNIPGLMYDVQILLSSRKQADGSGRMPRLQSLPQAARVVELLTLFHGRQGDDPGACFTG